MFEDVPVVKVDIHQVGSVKTVYKKNLTSEELREKTDVLLSPCEQEKYIRIKRSKRKLDFLYGRLALKKLLRRENSDLEYHQLSIENRVSDPEKGRPYVANALEEYFVSISHSAAFAFAGFSTNRIGVDCEFVPLKGDKFLFSYLVWSMKESFLKALGIGFRFGLDSVKIILDKDMQRCTISSSPVLQKNSADKTFQACEFMWDYREGTIFTVCVIRIDKTADSLKR